MAGDARVDADDAVGPQDAARFPVGALEICHPGEVHAIGAQRARESGVARNQRGSAVASGQLDQRLAGRRIERAPGRRHDQHGGDIGRAERSLEPLRRGLAGLHHDVELTACRGVGHAHLPLG